ncbi:sensor histidine kinase N-terminal domain-containing protein [Devosia sp. A8/3-2]|nr:sensor histidine kinase N-terminal domain-containing protein [Devosia sp. A8/3-2]
MPANSFSIRRRILALAVALLLGAAVVLVVFIRDYAERAADRAFDRLLAASALTIAGAVQVENDAVIVELPFASFGMFSGRDRVFYAVEDPRGRAVTGYDDLSANLEEMQSAGPVFQDAMYRGELVRVASVGRLTSSASETDWVTIHVAETQNEREALANEILGNAIVPVVALTLLAVALVWFGIGRMFAPLYQLEQALRGRTPDDLSPLDVPVPVEVSQLVGALNAFMARLGSSMERLSGLVAEAAHEVRTPLASLRAQAEVAMDEQDPDAAAAAGGAHSSGGDPCQPIGVAIADGRDHFPSPRKPGERHDAVRGGDRGCAAAAGWRPIGAAQSGYSRGGGSSANSGRPGGFARDGPQCG